TPLKTQAISFFLSIIIAISLMDILKQGSIALASAFASCVSFSVMSILLRRHGVKIPILENIQKVFKMVFPFIILGSWTYLIGIYFYEEELLFFGNIGLGHANSSRLILLLGMVPAMILYFSSSFLMGVGEIRQILRRNQK
ncbi:MAG: hypothetical protein JJT78_13365, partial [Leptospira sp.]|nr:hypothetical protein [Leptospira sp.]